MTIAQTKVDRLQVRAPFPASTAVNIGDLLFWDNVAKFAKSAALRADLGSASANQADFTPLFFGIAQDQRLATETSVTAVATAPTGTSDRTVLLEGYCNATCASSTWEFGDLVGIARDGTNNVNLNQQVVKVNHPSLAIGQVMRREPTAVTTVQVYLSALKYGWFALLGSAASPVVLSGATDAIPAHSAATYVVATAGVDAMTLAAPTATVDDGLEITVTSTTANAHTITATGLLQTGTASVNVATFAAQKGAGLTLMAYQGKWNVLSQIGITFS